MKTKYLFIIFIQLLCFSFTNVNASSINYNLQIDKSMNFHENIIYNIDSKDVKRDGSYHFLTSILDKPVYFDLQEEVKYNKSKSTTSNGYKVTLQHTYPYMFLSKSRILNECFVNKDFKTNSKYISLSASEFYCSHRADDIKVVINTSLDVTSSNADSHNGNTYIWNNISNNFSLNFKVQIPPIEEDPMDHLEDEEDTNTDVDNSTKQKNSISTIVVTSVIVIVFIGLLFGFSVLKKKKEQLDEL